MTLLQKLESSTKKRHTLLTWITENYENLATSSSTDNNNQRKNIISLSLSINEQINQFLVYILDIDDSSQFESHFIAIRLSQLYSLSLLNLEIDNSANIFDSAELLSKILAEDEISLNKNEKIKKKNKLTTSKKSYTFTPIKDYAVTLLIQLFETFGERIKILCSGLMNSIFKSLKKILEKSKYKHATFMTSLLRLFNAMIRNCGLDIVEQTYISKFHKLTKTAFEDIYNDLQDFPIYFISTIIEIWALRFKQDTFIKDHSNDLLNAFYTRFIEGDITTYGLANDQSRVYTAKSLSEILFHYYHWKKHVTLTDIWNFYARFFREATTRDVKAGCMESLLHFISLCLTVDKTFLSGSKYLDYLSILFTVFEEDYIQSQISDDTARDMRFFQGMHELLLPYLGDSSKTQILFKILGVTIEAENNTNNDKPSTKMVTENPKQLWVTLAQLHLCKMLIDDLASSFANEDTVVDQIKSKLLTLATCDTFMLRIESVIVFKALLVHFPDYVSDVIEHSLNSLIEDFKRKEDFAFSRNHGHALIIAMLISLANKEYVKYDIILKITVFATTFIKQHTTSTHSTLYHKGICCWILLMGLMNYQDEKYLEMHTSQLFIFWKVLLTHTFTYRNQEDLYKNLEVRNHALTCLLTYLNTAKLDSDIATQISYLLTKCSNFNHSVTLKSSNIDNVLLINESKILQVYLKIHEYVKTDFNSALLILIMKNFSNPYLFQETTTGYLSSTKTAILKEDEKDTTYLGSSVNTLLRSNDISAFGLSSKINYDGVAELSIKSPKYSLLEISGSWPTSEYNWFNLFENEVLKPISPIFSMDYLIILYGKGTYSGNDVFSPRLTTTVIDSSMELFSVVFPYLNSKIQYSVMENLNLSMFSKITTPLRSVAIAANICVVIYNSLRIIQNDEIILDQEVGQLMLESLGKIEFFNDSYITRLKSACTGLIIAAVSRGLTDEKRSEYITENGQIIIKRISDVNEPYFRVYYAMSLASIFKYNPQSASFSSYFDIIFALINDPHPVVHSWSLKAMHVLLQKHLAITVPTVSKLLVALEDVLTDPNFGQYGSSTLRYNYNVDYNSYTVVSQIVATLAEILGPNLQNLTNEDAIRYKNIVNSSLLANDLFSQLISLSIYYNIATFKLDNLLNDKLYITSAIKTLKTSVVPALGSSYFNSKFTRSTELVSNNSTLKGVKDCFQLFSQLIRLQKKDMFIKQLDGLAWLYLTIRPTAKSVSEYFTEWILNSIEDDPRWFDKLYAMFNIPRGKLFNAFYKQVDSILALMSKDVTQETELKRAEERSINPNQPVTDAGLTDDLADTIQWKTKGVILNLLETMCKISMTSPKLKQLILKKLTELIRISFQASTMRIAPIRFTGLNILDFIIKEYSVVPDPENPDHSILEQQEAQITSALMPAFSRGSTPEIMASAIIVGAQFLSSNVIPLNRLGRISQLLIGLLGDFENNVEDIKVGDASILTLKARKKIELAILNGWAQIIQKGLVTNNEELITFTKGYWHSLIYLWIISLREYVMVKYESVKSVSVNTDQSPVVVLEMKNSQLELYGPVWLNFVETLGCLLKEDQNMILECLNEEEIESFMFILLTQCLEAIIKNIDSHEEKRRVLPALHNILKCGVSLDSLFDDDIHVEMAGTLERLIIVGNEEEKSIIIDIIDDLLHGYISQNTTEDAFLAGVDKLYEYLRLLLLIISSKLPFLKFSNDESNNKDQLSKTDITLIKKAFSVFETNVSNFDSVFKYDLDACLLYMVGKVFKSEMRNALVPTLLPLLKNLLVDLSKNKDNIKPISIFFQSTKEIIFEKLDKENMIATLLVLVNNGFSDFSKEEITTISQSLAEGFNEEGLALISFQALKAIIGNMELYPACQSVIKKTLAIFGDQYATLESTSSAESILEVVGFFAEKSFTISPAKARYSFALYMSFIIWFSEKTANNLVKAGSKLVNLAKIDADIFKSSMNEVLTAEQKTKIGSLLSDYQTTSQNSDIKDNGSLQLKSFS